jgi:hypothetical protein
MGEKTYARVHRMLIFENEGKRPRGRLHIDERIILKLIFYK